MNAYRAEPKVIRMEWFKIQSQGLQGLRNPIGPT